MKKPYDRFDVFIMALIALHICGMAFESITLGHEFPLWQAFWMLGFMLAANLYLGTRYQLEEALATLDKYQLVIEWEGRK